MSDYYKNWINQAVGASRLARSRVPLDPSVFGLSGGLDRRALASGSRSPAGGGFDPTLFRLPWEGASEEAAGFDPSRLGQAPPGVSYSGPAPGGPSKPSMSKAAAGGMTFGQVGALIGGAWDIYDSYRERKRYKNALRRARRRGGRVADRMERTTRNYYDVARRQYEQMPGLISQGYKEAREGAGQAFRGAQAQTVASSQKSTAQAAAGLQAQGVQASSIYTNLRAGMGAQTSWALQSIYDRMAQMDAQLAIGAAESEAAARAQLGQFSEREHDAIQQANNLRFQLATMR